MEEDTRAHCPLFMAGLCFRGRACPLSHGTGIQTEDDLAAALVAAAYIADPEVQLAAALAASMTDFTRGDFDPSNLQKFQRDFHTKETAFRQAVSCYCFDAVVLLFGKRGGLLHTLSLSL